MRRLLVAVGWAAACAAQQCTNGPRSGTDGHAAYGACNSLTTGSVCVPSCAAGYSISGSFVLNCDAGLQYDATGATCTPNTCTNGPNQNADANAIYTACNALKTDQSCAPTCPAGFSAAGTFTLTCIGGFYNAAGATCQPQACTNGPTNPNALVDYTSCNTKLSGQSCQPTCQSGYTAGAAFTLQCVSLKYTATFTCSPNTCSAGPSANADPNADYSTCNTMGTGQACSPVCKTGYTLVGSFTLACSAGKYDANGASCQANVCTGGPNANADAAAVYTGCNALVTGQVCVPTCSAGATPSGSFVLACVGGRYDAAGATCSATACSGGPSANADANANYATCNTQTSGSTCTPTCNAGYNVLGSFTMTCTAGKYNAAGATCTAGLCTSGPVSGADARATYTQCNSQTTGTSCTPQCSTGYVASGNLALVCTALKYPAAAVTCVPSACAGGPTNPATNANYALCSAKNSGEQCVPTCPTGYSVQGQFTLNCVAGTYSATGATCNANPCTNGPTTGQDARAVYTVCNGATTGTTCTPTCTTGYSPTGSFQLVCTGGNYAATGATCSAKACKNGPRANAHAAAVYTGCNTLVTGQTCTPSCNSGYTRSGTFTLNCDAGETYDAAGATCIAGSCTKGPNAFVDGAATYTTCNTRVSGQTCTPVCATGYTLQGSFTLVCNSGFYSAEGATCSANACSGGPNANVDANAQYTACNSLFTGGTCTPVCNSGFTPTGSFKLTCVAAQYDAAGATCGANLCTGGPSANIDPQATYTACNALKSGQTCTPTCATGYTLTGSFTLVCNSLKYSAAGATCTPNACTNGPNANADPQMANYNACTAMKSGQTCTPTCNTGFVLTGTINLVCSAGLQFDAAGATCSDCSAGPSANADPNAVYTTCNTQKSGTQCTPTCATGYTASGPLTLTCTAGAYDAAGVTCVANVCGAGPGTSKDANAVYTACNAQKTGDTCTPTCLTGYTIAGSFTLVCPGTAYATTGATCTPNTCLNGPSAAADTKATYTACNAKKSGETCIPVCQDGYHVLGSFKLVCNSDQYSAAGASCAAVSCSGGPLVMTKDAHASYDACNLLTSGKTCTPVCASGYQLSKSFDLVCKDTTYDASAAKCDALNCLLGPQSGADPNAVYTACNSLVSGQVCKPTCGNGYVLVGEFTLACVASKYPAAGATCSATACASGPSTGAAPGADYTLCNVLKSGQSCTPQCPTGYTASGVLSLVCVAGGYDASSVTCLPNLCTAGPLTSVPVGADFSACNLRKSGETCAPVCATGYAVQGTVTLSCTAAGYNASGATCIPNTCTNGPNTGAAPNANYAACNAMKTGQTCTPACDAGYTVSGVVNLVCTSNVYSATGALCAANTCKGGPTSNTDGNAYYDACNALSTGATCTPSCITGYTNDGSFTLVCPNTFYDASGSQCKPNICSSGPIFPPLVGDLSLCSSQMTGSVCTPSCPTGYEAQSATITCFKNNTFNARGIDCIPSVCTGGPTTATAADRAVYTTCNVLKTGQSCVPTCQTGYTVSGSINMVCVANQGFKYDATGAECIDNRVFHCRNGPTNAGAFVDYSACNASFTGNLCTPVCLPGYRMAQGAPFTLSCRNGDYEDTSKAGCVANTCTSPYGGNAHTNYGTCNTLSTGQQCTPTCLTGYKSAGAFAVTCWANGTYAALNGCVPNACTGGPTVTNPNVDYSECNKLSTGGLCAVKCVSGYRPSGSQTITCSDTNKYTLTATCSPFTCQAGPNRNGNGNVDYSSCNVLSTGATCQPACFPGQGAQTGTLTLACDANGGYDAGDASCSILCGTSTTPCSKVGQCQLTVCTGNTCGSKNKADGTLCNDGSVNTVNDKCTSGVCAGTSLCAGVVCLPSSQCHQAGTCNPATGTCTTPSKPNNAPCDDQNPLTLVDSCVGGVCVGTSRCGSTCFPSDQCHAAGVCDAATGLCSQPNVADGTACSDGNPATSSDQCVVGFCSGSIVCGATVCPKPQQCHMYECQGTSCKHVTVKDGVPCNDGNPRTTNDTCIKGACTGWDKCANVPCSMNQCVRAGLCNFLTGVVDWLPMPVGTMCDDKNDETIGDTCQYVAGDLTKKGRSCRGSYKCSGPCLPFSQCHDVGRCDQLTGICTNPYKPDGTPCNDGDASTSNDVCTAGHCAGIIPCTSDCRAVDSCHVATCDGSGCRQFKKPDGAACSTGQNTMNDRCVNGICFGDPACNTRTCIAPSGCHTASCDVNGMCVVAMRPDFTPCNDGHAQTTDDMCRNGVCCGTGACGGKTCVPESSCHYPGTCGLDGRCTSPRKPDGTPCDDGSNATINDVCTAGVCAGKASCTTGATICPFGVCQLPACNGTVCTQLWAGDGSFCDDANTATETDRCVGGRCVGVNPCDSLVCNARDQCHEVGQCRNGVCSNPTAPEGRLCDDGNPATSRDQCKSGVCVGIDRCSGVLCRASDSCHFQGVCNPLTGLCVEKPVKDGTPCSDGNPDTTGDICMAGKCSGDLPCGSLICKASQCNKAVCVGNTCAKQVLVDGTACNDDNPATSDDKCQSGVCIGLDKCAGVTCLASSQCYDKGTCDSATGLCVTNILPDYSACSDGSALTIEDYCISGVCKGRSRCENVTCTASDHCHYAGTCDLNTGLCTDPVKSDGSACSDGDLATVNDRCVAGLCTVSLPCGAGTCDTPKQCHKPVCDNNICRHSMVADGTSCNDGVSDTLDDVCTQGVCRGVRKCDTLVCPPEKQCRRSSTCLPATGCSTVLAADLTACDDGNSSTVVDRCLKGQCIGRPRCLPSTCTSKDDCHEAGVCDWATGLCTEVKKTDGTPCDDGNTLTLGDVCTDGRCSGRLPCSGGSCPLPGICRHALCNSTCEELVMQDGAACNDNNPETFNDMCDKGNCVGTDKCANVTCGTASQCLREGVCDKLTGECVFSKVADQTDCDDGIPESMDDVCIDGVCRGTDRCSNNPCAKTDDCHSVGVCVHGTCTDPVLPDGTPCNDGDTDTNNDVCTNGVCSGTILCNGIQCRALSPRCQKSVCQGVTCTQIPRTDNTLCSDGDSNTRDDKCRAGVCVGTTRCTGVVCAAISQCHGAGVCSPVSLKTNPCSTPILPDGTPCNDQNDATTVDACQQGVCIGTVRTCETYGSCGRGYTLDKSAVCPASGCTSKVCCRNLQICVGVICSASDQCHHTGSCDPTSGLCTDPPKADGTLCDDGSPATSNDRCDKGVCLGTLVCGTTTCNPVNTGSALQCRLPSCSGVTCIDIEKPNGTPCNDGNATTAGDVCNQGKCSGFDKCAKTLCSASDQCHEAGICHFATGTCSDPPRAHATPCNDGMSHTVDDKCIAGACVGVTPCNGANCTSSRPQCFASFCEQDRCVEKPKPDGTACNDENGSTEDDTCVAGVCKGVDKCFGVVCPPATQCHQPGFCLHGKCSENLKPNGSPCDDNDATTTSDVCTFGTCRGTTRCTGVVCRAHTACQEVGVCEPDTGLCTEPSKADGTVCDDGDSATTNDRCVDGICKGDLTCGIGRCGTASACKRPICAGTVCGTANVLDNTPCNDNNPATWNDTCSAGVCVGVSKCSAVLCTALDDCHDTMCDPATGVCIYPSKPNHTICNDNTPYTSNDQCVSGVCTGADNCANVQCKLSTSPCLTTSCDSITGQCSYNLVTDGTTCDDGLVSTTGDSCLAGVCVGSVRCSQPCLTQSQCHTPSCVSNTCQNLKKPDNTACFDLRSSSPGLCVDGSCQAEADPCAGVVCYPKSQCHRPGTCQNGNCTSVPVPDGAQCDDMKADTGNDRCVSGMCVGRNLCAGVTCGVTPAACRNAGTCDPRTGVCTEPASADGTVCDDGDATTVNDRCVAGVCVSSKVCGTSTCSTTRPCFTSECSGATCVEIEVADGTQCHDGNENTIKDVCKAGACVGDDLCLNVVCPPTPCGTNTCTRGVCTLEAAFNGTACNDGRPETVKDVCSGGVCKGVNLCEGVVCKEVDQCHGKGTCDFATGLCTEPRAADGTPCDDKNPATPQDTCRSGQCVSTAPCTQACTSGSTCETVTCVSGVCQIIPQADGTACTDENPLTIGDICQGGVCQGADLCKNVQCSARGQCHVVGACDPKTGNCVESFKPDGTACDDADVQTIRDVCQQGICKGASRCTPDLCKATQCMAATCAADFTCQLTRVPDNTPCDDRDVATVGDVCVQGVCIGRISCGTTQCGVPQQCGRMRCTFQNTCEETVLANGSPCEDGDVKTKNDACRDGKCVGIPLCTGVVCPAQGQCYVAGKCDEYTGLCTTPLSPENSFCDDGNRATENDRCIMGACIGTNVCANVTCPNPDQCHTAYICNPLNGLCENQKKADRTACNDGNSETNNDVCFSGFCRGEVVCAGSICRALDACHTVLCTGSTCTHIAVTDSRPCDDGKTNTINDVCMGGTCSGVDPCHNVVCNPIDQCHVAGICQPNGKCTNPLKPDMSPCDDGVNETLPDVCMNGLCTGTARCDGVTCIASDTCHLQGVCDPATGLCTDPPKVMGAQCDDGRSETTNDQCLPDVGCTGVVSCSEPCVPTGPCKYSICNNTVCGELPKRNGEDCNDGNAFTVEDTCVEGVCKGRNPCDSINCVTVGECKEQGVCDPAKGICTTPNRADGALCNAGQGRCDNGICSTQDKCAGVVCAPSDSCHNAGICDTATGFCSDPIKADGILCDDKDPLTTSQCKAGNCVSRIQCGATVCNSQDPCHTVRCIRDNCVAVPKADGTSCNDGNVISVGDVCKAGNCVGTLLCQNVVCTTTNLCLNTGTCDARNGTCFYPPKSDGTVCGSNKRCMAGLCLKHDACAGTSCFPSSQCRLTGPCTSQGGCTETPKPDGTPCDDGSITTVGDACSGGVCFGVQKCQSECPAPDACHYPTQCDLSGLCQHGARPDGTACDDLDPTTSSSSCLRGNCIGTTSCNQRPCTASGPCHTAVCKGSLCTQVLKPDGTLCDDNKNSTFTDSCVAGRCVGKSPCAGKQCPAVDECHAAGSCDVLTGRCSAPLLQDGTPCGVEMTCDAGVCKGRALSSCATFSSTTCQLHADPSTIMCRECKEAICCVQCSTFDDDACPSGRLIGNPAAQSCAVGGCNADTCCAPSRCAGGCPASDGCHLLGACDEDTGLCSDPVAPDGLTCDDNDASTQNDACKAGVCVGIVVCGNQICRPVSECYTPYCNGQTCAQRPKYDGATCNDGNIFTVLDECRAGVCRGEDKCTNVVCTPVSQCHDAGVCDPVTGLCSEPAKIDGVACDDGNDGTSNDQCLNGHCSGGVICGRVLCRAPVCQAPSCVQGTCVTNFVNGACDDADPLTTKDSCREGKCRGITRCAGIVCTKPDQCHKTSNCDPRTGLCIDVPLLDGTACNDGNDATTTDRCSAGACIAPVLCNGEVCRPTEPQCHTARCENSKYVVARKLTQHILITHPPLSRRCILEVAVDNKKCNDNNEKTVDDRCVGGRCVGVDLCATVQCPADACHGEGSCNPENGLCDNPTRRDGTTCDDGNDKTTEDACRLGKCVGAVPCEVPCTAADSCHTARCVNRQCVQDVSTDGTTCDDEIPTTANDRCVNGVCVGTPVCANVACVALDQCHSPGVCRAGVCTDPPAPDGQGCDDGNQLTTGDRCLAGVCVGTTTCGGTQCRTSEVQCRATACEGNECVEKAKPDGTACDDGNLLTGSDRCQSGICIGDDKCSSVRCEPSDTCHTSNCSPVSGKCEETAKAERTLCNDGNPATTDDMCIAGKCAGVVWCNNKPWRTDKPMCMTVVCSGAVGVEKPAADGTKCNDGNADTSQDVCKSGLCSGRNLCEGVTCQSSKECLKDGVCDPATGQCVFRDADLTSSCNDGSALTIDDRCRGGACIGSLQCGSTVCPPTNVQCATRVCGTGSVCAEKLQPNGTPCDDGNPATANDACQEGACRGSDLCFKVVCPQVPCAQSACDPKTGACVETAAADGKACGVGGSSDVCEAGKCIGAIVCGGAVCKPASDAMAQCKMATCSATDVCGDEPKPDGTPCNDGDAKTTNDACTNGVCGGLNKCDGVTCETKPCFGAGRCDTLSGLCIHKVSVDGTACDDNDPATKNDACVAGQCRGKTDATCGTCEPAGACFEAVCLLGQCKQEARVEGSQCDDGKAETLDDRCRSGVCAGVDKCANVACAASSTCQKDSTCNANTGRCYPNAVVADGTACTGGRCQTGICVPEVTCGVLTCNVTHPVCKVAVCDSLAGKCLESDAPLGTTCDDADDATVRDTCVGGACVGVNLCTGVVCTPANECHAAGVCDAATGLCSSPNKPDGAVCNDGNPSTVDERCVGGRCLSVDLCGGKSCVSKSQCTTAVCISDKCIQQVSVDGASCEDGRDDTFDDVCVAGVCVGTGIHRGLLVYVFSHHQPHANRLLPHRHVPPEGMFDVEPLRPQDRPLRGQACC